MPDQLHIFISYARKDGRDLALRLRCDLIERGHDVWLDTAEIEGGASWSNEIETAIDRCEVALALLSTGSYHSEICRAEQLRSLRKGKRVIPLLAQRDSERPLHLEHLNYRDFSDASRYATALQTLLGDIGSGEIHPLPDAFRTTFNNAPPLPPTFVNRPDELDRLRRAVVGDGGSRQVALTALRGMGGIGKSVLAAALCQDDVVQAAFPDGIFWVEIGREARELVPRMAQIGARLGDDPKLYGTLRTSQANLRNLMRSKAALIVLDDVWDAKVVDLFKVNAPRCRTLFTTRDGTIAQQHDAREVHLGTMTPGQSLELLCARAGRDDPRLAEIAERLGHLPLALKLAGAHLSEGMSAAEWLENFQHVAQIKLGRRSSDPHENLQVCFDLSVQRLAEADRPLYYALGIFAQDVAIPSTVIHLLWRRLEPELTLHDSSELLTELARLELLERHPDNTVTLHDLLQDYCHAALALAGQVAATHAMLLAAYNPQAQAWPTIPHDGYLYHHLIYHLIEASRQEEARGLLFDFAWLQAKLVATDVTAVLRDFDSFPNDAEARLVHEAIKRSGQVLRKDHTQLAGQLLGRLLARDEPAICTLLDQAAQWRGAPWLRPLTSSLLPPGDPLLFTLAGHEGTVRSLAVTPDGRWGITAGNSHPDQTVRLWDFATGTELRTLPGQADPSGYNPVGLTPDGHYGLVARDGNIHVWNVATGREVTVLHGHAGCITALDVAGNGHRAFTGADDGSLVVWDLVNRQQTATLPVQPEPVHAVAITPDGRYAVTLTASAIKHWDLERHQETATLPWETGFFSWFERVPLALSPDGRHVYFGSPLQIWHVGTPESQPVFAIGDPGRVMAVTPDGRIALASPDNSVIVVWDIARQVRLTTLPGHKPDDSGRSIATLTLTPDGLTAVVALYDHYLKVWALEFTAQSVATPVPGNAVDITPDGRFAVVSERGAIVDARDLDTGRPLPAAYGAATRAVQSTWEGRAAQAQGAYALIEPRLGNGSAMPSFRRPKPVVAAANGVRALTYTPARGKTSEAAEAGPPTERYALRLWNLTAPDDEPVVLLGHSSPIMAVAMTPDGRHAVSGCIGRTLRVWDLEAGRERQTLPGHDGIVWDVQITPDGRFAVSASEDRTIRVWDLHAREQRAIFTADLSLRRCAVRDDGSAIAAVDALGHIHLLRLEGV